MKASKKSVLTSLIFAGHLQKRKWENAMTLDKQSWGFRRNMVIADVLSMEELLATFASTVRYLKLWGKNLLLSEIH